MVGRRIHLPRLGCVRERINVTRTLSINTDTCAWLLFALCLCLSSSPAPLPVFPPSSYLVVPAVSIHCPLTPPRTPLLGLRSRYVGQRWVRSETPWSNLFPSRPPCDELLHCKLALVPNCVLAHRGFCSDLCLGRHRRYAGIRVKMPFTE